MSKTTPIEVECGFSVVSGYLQCSTERRLLGIFSAALKIALRVRTAAALIRMQCRFGGHYNALEYALHFGLGNLNSSTDNFVMTRKDLFQNQIPTPWCAVSSRWVTGKQ